MCDLQGVMRPCVTYNVSCGHGWPTRCHAAMRNLQGVMRPCVTYKVTCGHVWPTRWHAAMCDLQGDMRPCVTYKVTCGHTWPTEWCAVTHDLPSWDCTSAPAPGCSSQPPRPSPPTRPPASSSVSRGTWRREVSSPPPPLLRLLQPTWGLGVSLGGVYARSTPSPSPASPGLVSVEPRPVFVLSAPSLLLPSFLSGSNNQCNINITYVWLIFINIIKHFFIRYPNFLTPSPIRHNTLVFLVTCYYRYIFLLLYVILINANLVTCCWSCDMHTIKSVKYTE